MAIARQPEVKKVRVPITGTLQNRSASLSKDQRMINCIIESYKNPLEEKKQTYVIKRPGTSLFLSSGVTGVGRGCAFWNNAVYSVIGNKLVAGSTVIATLTTSTGMCSFIESNVDSSHKLCMADGAKIYVIETNNTVTTVALTLTNWTSSTVMTVGQRRIPTTANGYYYEVTVAGTTSGTEPTWPTNIGEQKTDGGVTWKCAGWSDSVGVWTASKAYVAFNRITVTSGTKSFLFECTIAGTSSGTAPTWNFTAGQTVTDGTVTWVCIGENRGSPVPDGHEPSFAYIDGYLCLIVKRTDGSKSSDIYNSDLDNPFSWSSASFVTAEMFPDNLSALARQNNYIVAFGETSIEFFFDNPSADVYGTPFARNESYTQQHGIAAPNVIMQTEKFCAYIGQSASGGRCVWVLDGFQPKKISNEYIERVLDAEGTSILNATGYGLRTNGHFLFVINLTSLTFVFDFEEQQWTQWTSGSNKFAYMSAADDQGGKIILQHESNGNFYKLDPALGTDAVDGTIPVEIITTKLDFENMRQKVMTKMMLTSDTIVGDTVDVRWSDDDYTTWSNWSTLNLSPRCVKHQMGQFRRRALHLKYTGTNPIRFEDMEFEYKQGVA